MAKRRQHRGAQLAVFGFDVSHLERKPCLGARQRLVRPLEEEREAGIVSDGDHIRRQNSIS
ncbi:MAG TPA: hypothetical protein VJB57_18490 [Dehalococcoidia bacterium]|nr:hypothetical protein [Dehalococcoidia bacterium]